MAKQNTAQRKTIGRVMHEFKHGELKRGRGSKVKNPKQAIAIALSEAGTSKYQSPAENRRRLAHTKAKERRGETAQQEKEGRMGASRERRGSAKRSSRATQRRAAPVRDGRRSPGADPRRAVSARTPARHPGSGAHEEGGTRARAAPLTPMVERASRTPPRKGEPRAPERTDNATNQHPKGTPTEERHETEVAGGQVRHDEPLTTRHPAGGKRNRDGERA